MNTYKATLTQETWSDPVASVFKPIPFVDVVWTRKKDPLGEPGPDEKGMFLADFGFPLTPENTFVLACPREYPDEPFFIKSAKIVDGLLEVRTAKVEDRVNCDNVEFYIEISIKE